MIKPEALLVGVAILGGVAFVALLVLAAMRMMKGIQRSESAGAASLQESARSARNLSWVVGIGYFVILTPLFTFITLNDAQPQQSPPVTLISLIYLISALGTHVLYSGQNYKESIIASRVVFLSPLIVFALLLVL